LLSTIILEMTLTAEQHAQLATTYEKAAADGLAAPQQQAALLRKANWFRMLARLAEKNEQRARLLSPPAEFSVPKGTRLGGALKYLLTVLR
jgi:hypothetical protein